MAIAEHCRADTLIIGGGLVGAAQALALAEYEIRSVVVDKAKSADVLAAGYDGRVSAISHASVQLLKALGVWRELQRDAGPIETIRVTEGGRFSDVIFDSREESGEPFGYMVPNIRLRQVLLERVVNHPCITFLEGETLEAFRRDAVVEGSLASGQTVSAELLIIADGRYSSVREQVGVSARRFEYGQNALVTTISHSQPHEGCAVEWFFPAGPLAILPMRGGYHSCIVWTEKTALAEHLATLEREELQEELALKLNGMLGEIAVESPCFSYPLNLFQAERYTAERTAIIGDAAHAIHPIAGQGVNLGYRDVAVLTELLVEAVRHGQDPGNAALLAHYQRWRSFDATSMIAVTDGLNRLFSTESRVIGGLRRAGMGMFERVAPVKRFFMLSAMGMTGDLPKLLQGESL